MYVLPQLSYLVDQCVNLGTSPSYSYSGKCNQFTTPIGLKTNAYSGATCSGTPYQYAQVPNLDMALGCQVLPSQLQYLPSCKYANVQCGVSAATTWTVSALALLAVLVNVLLV